jgi:hypothetical protein
MSRCHSAPACPEPALRCEISLTVLLRLTPPPAASTPPQIEYGGQCHISNRPYTVFRWKPGNDARYKKTIVCQEVAKAKNVCQVRVGTRRGQQDDSTGAANRSALWVPWRRLLTEQLASPCLPLPCLLQVCLLDLEYGLPVQVRDAALAKQDEGLPQSDAGREYALQRMQVRWGRLECRAVAARALEHSAAC